jgi:YD repeat-containing protein
MKKFFSILAAFFLGLFISISIIACADNDDDSSLGQLSWAEFKELRNARVLKLVCSNAKGSETWEYKYDDKGRISNMHRKGVESDGYTATYTYHVTYSGNTINIVNDRENPTHWEVTVSEGAMMVPFVVNEFIRDMIYAY